MLAADIDARLHGLTSLHVREVVHVLIVSLVTVNREGSRAAQGSDGVGRRIVDADDRRLIAASDIHEGRAKAKAEAEFPERGGAEHVGLGSADVLLPVVLVGRFAV